MATGFKPTQIFSEVPLQCNFIQLKKKISFFVQVNYREQAQDNQAVPYNQ